MSSYGMIFLKHSFIAFNQNEKGAIAVNFGYHLIKKLTFAKYIFFLPFEHSRLMILGQCYKMLVYCWYNADPLICLISVDGSVTRAEFVDYWVKVSVLTLNIVHVFIIRLKEYRFSVAFCDSQ